MHNGININQGHGNHQQNEAAMNLGENETERSQAQLSVKYWSTSITDIFDNDGYRLDATHYDPQVTSAIKRLVNSGYELRPLSSLASVELRSQFTRIWASDEQHGIKYWSFRVFSGWLPFCNVDRDPIHHKRSRLRF